MKLTTERWEKSLNRPNLENLQTNLNHLNLKNSQKNLDHPNIESTQISLNRLNFNSLFKLKFVSHGLLNSKFEIITLVDTKFSHERFVLDQSCDIQHICQYPRCILSVIHFDWAIVYIISWHIQHRKINNVDIWTIKTSLWPNNK